MRRTKFAVAMALVSLAGCQTGPSTYIYKPGVNFAGKQAAVDECKIASLREIPQAMATEVSGGYYNPGTVQCNTIGTSTFCNRVGAVNVPPSSTTYDANQGIRERYIARCLQAKGFTVTTLPMCQGDAQRAAARTAEDAGQLPSCIVGDRRLDA